MSKHQLIGAALSLYTGKLRCYLRYKGIAFEDVLATREVYRDIIIPRTGVRYIPVLITDDDQALQDTTVIIDALEQRYPERSVYPTAPMQRLIALLLETYADEWLVIPAMYYRWSFAENRDFAIREFGRTSAPDASAEEQWAIGEENSKPFADALPKLGVTTHNSAALEASYLALLKDLDHHFARYPFLLGDKPCIGDFGLMGPLYAHLYRDPYSGRVLSEAAPQVEAWIRRMLDPIAHRHTAERDFLAEDQLPGSLLPVLTRMFKEQGPVLLQTINQVKDWANHNAQAPLPRAIGECRFTVEGVEATRLTFPYMLWMWQRCADAYQRLNSNDQLRMNEWLSAVPNALELLNAPIAQRVGRENNRVVLI